MHFTKVSAAASVAFIIPSLAAPLTQTNATESSFLGIPKDYLTVFKNPILQSSIGGHAICISGIIDVAASANNVQLNIKEPANQIELTELFVESFQVNSTLAKRVIGGQSHVNGTYGIYSQLCFPKTRSNDTTLQFLIHGAGYDRNYWNIAQGYSYVDFAAEQGYTTFLYDRLGTGLSDHPDPVQIVQMEIQVAIAHQLIQLLRTATFKQIIGVGHSVGSFQTVGITSHYPSDFDAVVLTGFSNDSSGMDVAFAGVGLTIASQNQPLRFANLSHGYLTSNSMEGIQTFFFRAPGFDPELLKITEATKQTIALGEYFSVPTLFSPNFTGPVYTISGESDLPNCHGNCSFPYNKLAAVKDTFYPAASNTSAWDMVPGTGHGLNAHYAAPKAFELIHKFIKARGF